MRKSEIKEFFVKYPVIGRSAAVVNVLLMPILILIAALPLVCNQLLPEAWREIKVLLRYILKGELP